MATFTVEITPDSINGTIAHATGKFSGGSSSYKGQRRMDVTVSGVGTFSALSPETSGGENTFSLDITGLTPGTTYNWSVSLYYKNTSGGWVTAGSQYDKSGSFTTANSGTTSTVPLSAKAVGSIVKLKVNGTAKEFVVVHQGKPSSLYDDSCNGTWLLMKDIYENRQWHSSNVNNLENSTIHTYLNNTFLNLFDSDIRDAIKQVKIPYRKNGGSSGSDQSGANGLSCKIFLLSGYEVGWTSSDNQYFPQDGAKLSYFESGTGTSANNKRIANLNGSAAVWWLRSPYTSYTNSVWGVYLNSGYSYYSASNSLGIRPALVLPPDMEVDSSGNVTPPPPATHKTLVNGTVYEVKGGKCMVGGTVYNILKGRTLINGTGYDITFAPPFPKKGDLITMNLDGTDRLYRVLKIVDGTTVEVMTMWNVSDSLEFDSGNTNTYSGKTLDTYLNTTWYNTLSSTAKAAIVPKNINQYQYSHSSSTYNKSTHPSYADYSTKALKANVGERYVYALDVEDIEMYFGGTGGSVDNKTPATFSTTDLLQMFWNQISTISEYPWFRSARADNSDRAWFVFGTDGYVYNNYAANPFAVRGAFQIDLSKIDFTIN